MNDCAELERRIKTILPDEYQDCYEDVEPVSMGSAGLRFAPDGKVAWDEMWATFCDLALAGGPPHKGTLLEPAAKADVDGEPGRYSAAVEEICRGVRMVTDLEVHRSPLAGWVRVACLSDTMAGWLLRAITMENVAVRAEGATIELPAGPRFRIEKEIKNVVTVMAKTCHYWLGHTTRRQKQQIAQMFVALSEESTLLVPALSEGDTTARAATQAGLSIEREIGLPVSSRRYVGWLGVECPTVRAALWMTRALVVSNVLSRREDTTLFLPVNPEQDPDGHRVAGAMIRTRRSRRRPRRVVRFRCGSGQRVVGPGKHPHQGSATADEEAALHFPCVQPDRLSGAADVLTTRIWTGDTRRLDRIGRRKDESLRRRQRSGRRNDRQLSRPSARSRTGQHRRCHSGASCERRA